jgi:hypothetical protein
MPRTSVTLYRRGNSKTPRMDHVRDDDVARYVNHDGVECVIARSGGISCFDTTPCPGKGPEWRLPAGTEYPDDLYLRDDPDEPDHWTWEPEVDMTMTRYKDLLATVGLSFQPS